MIENYLQESRKMEMDTFGSTDVAELKRRRPGITLYKKDKEEMISRDDIQSYLPMLIHSFYLDLSQVIPESEACHSDSRVLAKTGTGIRHDLVAGGSAEVGVLEGTLSEDSNTVVRRGFVRMLYQTEENGPISETYILCDINSSSSSKRRLEQRIVPTAPDAPTEMMTQPGYLDLVEVELDRF